MATQPTLEGSGATTTDGTSVSTSAAVTPAADSNYLVIAWARHTASSTDPSVPAISGWTGVTWDEVDATNGHADRTAASCRIFSFRARVGGSPPSAAALTATWAESLGGMGIAVVKLPDTDAGGTNGSGAIVQVERAIDQGSGTVRAIAMAAEGSVDNGCIAFFIEGANAVPPLGSGWTSLHTANLGSPNWGVRVQWINDVPSSVDGATSTAGWAGVAIELKHAAAAGAQLEAVLTGAATLAVVLTTEITPAAQLAGSGSVGAALTTEITLAAALTGTGVVAAELTAGDALAAALTGTGVVAADLTTEITLAGSLAGAGSVDAALTTTITLAAVLAGSGTLAGDVTVPLVPLEFPALDVRIDWDMTGTFDVADSVTGQLERLDYDRGASFDGAAEGPGSIRLLLANDDDRYSPDNASSPLAGKVRPGRRVWARASFAGTTYALCYGTIRRVIPMPWERMVEIVAEDPLYAIGRGEVSLAVSATRSIRSFREAVLTEVDVPAVSRDLADGVESDIPLTSADQEGAIGLLERLNAATASLHFVRPSTDPGVLYQYVTRHRVSLATGVAVETYDAEAVDGLAIDAYDLTDEAIVNSQRVAPDLRDLVATDTLWESDEVAFSVPAGTTRTLWASFSDPAFEQAVVHDSSGSPTVTLTPFSRSAKIDIVAGASDAEVRALSVTGRAAVAVPGASSLSTDPASMTAHGERRGSTISGEFFASLAAAKGVGDWRVYRYAAPKARPGLAVVNRWPSQMQREVGDRIALTASLLSLTARPFLIRRLATTITHGGRHWETRYMLEEAPATDTWFTLGGSAAEGVGGSGKLAY